MIPPVPQAPHWSNGCLSIYAQLKFWSDKTRDSTSQKPCNQSKWGTSAEVNAAAEVRIWNIEACLGFFYSFKWLFSLCKTKPKQKNNPKIETASVVLQSHWLVMKARLLELELRKALKVTLLECNNAWIVKISHNRYEFPFCFSGPQF